MPPALPLPQAIEDAPQSQNPFQRTWQNLSRGTKLGFAIAAVIGLLLIIIASIAISSSQPEHSQRYKDCEAVMVRDGYKGESLQKAIQFCVDAQ
jgi:hypothetical protein